jgi:predicted MFS family arabinose efflux permease
MAISAGAVIGANLSATIGWGVAVVFAATSIFACAKVMLIDHRAFCERLRWKP